MVDRLSFGLFKDKQRSNSEQQGAALFLVNPKFGGGSSTKCQQMNLHRWLEPPEADC